MRKSDHSLDQLIDTVDPHFRVTKLIGTMPVGGSICDIFNGHDCPRNSAIACRHFWDDVSDRE
jgi:hypothetical protein